MEGTLAEMRVVYEHAQTRRKEVEGALPEAAQEVLNRMSRPATTEEMVLLTEEPIGSLMCTVNERLGLVCACVC